MKTSPDFSSNSLSRPNQLIDLNLLKSNLKNPIKPDEFLNKYLPQHQTIHKCLPAKFYAQPIFGQLQINFESIVFLSHVSVSKSKHVIYRCRMLGYTQEETPFFSNTITYTIHTNNKMFKHYMKDMKVCLVEVLDGRNYEPIGHSYINWLTYMKSTEDNEVLIEKDENRSKYDQGQKALKRYYLPFLDEQCFLTLPLFDYRNIKNLSRSPQHGNEREDQKFAKVSPKERIIGEIKLKFMSRIYEDPIALGYIPSGNPQNYGAQSEIDQQNNFDYVDNQKDPKVNVLPSFLEIPHINQIHNTISSHKNMISLKQLVPSIKNIQNQQRFDSIGSESSQKQPETLQLRRQPSNHSNFNLQKNSSKRVYNNTYKIEGAGSRLYSHEDHSKHNNRSSYDSNKTQMRHQILKNNELELLHLKLDVQEFFKNDGQVKQIQRQQKVFLQITKLKTKLLNINYLDVIFNENEQEYNSQNKQGSYSKPHIKIYKVSSDKNKNQDFFNSKLVIERSTQRIIEIQLPNNQGKCVFRCKDLTAPSNDICVYNRGAIVGVLSIKKQSQKKSINPTTNLSSKIHQTKTIQSQNSQPIKLPKDKICILVVDNFIQHVHKKSDLNQLSHLDNYTISIKNVLFFHESLKNSKHSGEYAISNCQAIPKLFAVEAKNSYNQFVGMSENINFEGNQVILSDQNIMPTLILERNLSIIFKQMPVFKKLPNSVSFRLSLYVANTNQLNYFINKWKQKVEKIKSFEIRKERSISNTRQIVGKHTDKGNTQKVKERQYTLSDEVSQTKHKQNQRVRTESQNKNSSNLNYKHIESKSSGVRQPENQRFKTQGNYTEDLNNENRLGNAGSQTKEHEEYSQKQGGEEEEIYLVEFFCKSLHYILYCLGSKRSIESKINELSNYHYTNKSAQTEQSKSISDDNSMLSSPKGLVSKQQFRRIIFLLIGQINEGNMEVLGFDVNQILEALFISEDGNYVKMQQFTLCLMAYYNFLLLLNNQKINAIKQLILCEPEAQQKLQKIHHSMTNINFEFLWEDVLSNVPQKTKQKISKRYRIYPNTPFSVNLLLNDLKLVKKNINDPNDQSFFKSLLDILTATQQKCYELFMKTTADLGSLVRQTVEEIIFSQSIKTSNISNCKNWIQDVWLKIEQFVRGENMDSIESEAKNQNSLNLTQFQELFSKIGIETSIWQSLMLIEEIKVWHEGDETGEKQLFEGGEGIITIKLVRSWLNGLKTKIQMRNDLRNLRGDLNTKSSRLNSMKSLDSDQEDIIEQMNMKKHQARDQKQSNKTNLMKPQQQRQQPNQTPIQDYEAVRMNQSSFQLKNDSIKRKQNASLKQLQTMNNESDIANIANLLRQNQNNLYFLPSITDPKSINKITSANNILSDENILPANDLTSLRNPLDPSPSKFSNQQPKKQPQLFQLISNSSEINQTQSSRLSHAQFSNQSVPAFLSVQIVDLSLKKKDIVLHNQGLKKITLSLRTKQTKSDKQSLQYNCQNQKIQEYYFLSREEVGKILANDKSPHLFAKFNLNNTKVDINNLYQFQTLFNQGLSFQLINLNNNPPSKKTNKTAFNQFDKEQKVLLTGILPIEDIVKQIQDFKQKILPGAQENIEQPLVHSKKKTIVLYSGKEIIGKVIAQITVSNQEFSMKKEDLSFQKIRMTKMKFSLCRKLISGKQKSLGDNKQKTSFLMCLSYCSVRNDQHIKQLLPMIGENTQHEIQLPEPIIEQQLIVRNLETEDAAIDENYLESSNLSNVSRFTRFDKSAISHQIPEYIAEKQLSREGKHECVIPLETLYFRKSLDQSYPLIDKESGRFVCSINARLEIINDTNQKNKKETSQRIIVPQNTKENQQMS